MLIDTNIILSLLLKQNDHRATEDFFARISYLRPKITILDFSLFSCAIILDKRKEPQLLKDFLKYLQKSSNFKIYHPTFEEIGEAMSQSLNLDFDDKLHYVIAKKQNLNLVSYDQDFDKTDLKRFTPEQALKLF